MKKIGAAIRKARAAASMSQTTLGELVGLDQGTVSLWEQGKREMSLDQIGQVEAALGKPKGWLLVAAGCVAEVRTVPAALAMDGTISADSRELLLGAYERAVALAAERPTPSPR